MKAKRELDDDKLMVIKLFVSNYARDLIYPSQRYGFGVVIRKI